MAIPVLASTLVNLALSIQEHYSALKSSKKRAQRLDGHIGVLQGILTEIDNHYGKSVPRGIQQAFRLVEVELKKVDALFKDLKQKGFVRNLIEAPSTGDKFQEIADSLDHAVNVLNLAQNWRHQQRNEEFQGHMADRMETLTSRTECLAHKVEHVVDFVEKLEERGEHQVDSDQMHWRYNENMMGLLQTQLNKIDEFLLGDEYQQLLRMMLESEELKGDDGEEQTKQIRWRSSVRDMAHARELGRLLISRHKKPFNLTKFYKTSEAQKAVEMICKELQSFLDRWGLSSVKIQTGVPPPHVSKDKAKLLQYLAYVLYDLPCNWHGQNQQEWHSIKERIQGLLDTLPVTAQHGDLELGEQIAGKVYKGTWQRKKTVAVKRLAEEDNPAVLDLEDFAEFFTTIVALAKMRSQYVVDIIGTTDSGGILMELGHSDLLKWLEDHRLEGLVARVRLLLQAAKGLQYVHEHGFVHRDVHTQKFVLFGDKGSPTVKITGFGLAIVKKEDGTMHTLRHHVGSGKSTAWVAPEIFHGEAYTAASDIYSFGIVLHHVVGGIYPYGRGTAPAVVSDNVARGELPSLPDDMKLPPALSLLMKKCCAYESAQRPKNMEAVCDELQAVYDVLLGQ